MKNDTRKTKSGFGANGHLGNNLVRLLLQKEIPVRATVKIQLKMF
jgi:dTDP-4-dehydrorhamnose reductase